MSTFNGIVSEFPRIRIDFFRLHPSQPPPLACFLSHIHSDHLQGLESLKAPFVYCSTATRRLLLRLEKYPHRMNFMTGVLESRKQHYRHLKLVLKAIPLECPTEIELGPLEKIRVTLFDANHCPGAVMFLVEGDSKAILYTGDIRSEPWWVNSLVRNPVLLPYATRLKQLNRLYLDTTFAVKEDLYKSFPSKAEGIQELLVKAQQYPPETLFYLNAWTLGYEDAWIALSSFLNSSVHIDSYQSRLYSSLSNTDDRASIGEYAALNGFYVGNHRKAGCLTTQSATRIHSCEPGTPCHAELLKAKQVVWITPIITRSKEGIVVPELGAGGGGGELHRTSELELGNISSVLEIEEFCKQMVQDPYDVERLLSKVEFGRSLRDPRMSLEGLGLDTEAEITLQEFAKRLLRLDNIVTDTLNERVRDRQRLDGGPLGDTIHFPFSRHSSYNELSDLVAAFKPSDIYPCTVEEQTWTEDVSMKTLFGHLCSGAFFRHDEEMRLLRHKRLENEEPPKKRQKRTTTEDSQQSSLWGSTSQQYNTAARSGIHIQGRAANAEPPSQEESPAINEEECTDQCEAMPPHLVAIKAAYDADMARAKVDHTASSFSGNDMEEYEAASPLILNHVSDSQVSIPLSAFDSLSEEVHRNAGLRLDGAQDDGSSWAVQSHVLSASHDSSDTRDRRTFREEAYLAAKLTLQMSDSGAWDDLGISSVGNNRHCEPEQEL